MNAAQEVEALKKALARTLRAIDHEPDQVVRARLAHVVADELRAGQGMFADVRKAALLSLRVDLGWTLSELAAELDVTSGRVAQLCPLPGHHVKGRGK